MFSGFVLGVTRTSEEDQTATGQHPPKKNPSSLTFAVKPCPVSTDSEAGTFSSDWHCHVSGNYHNLQSITNYLFSQTHFLRRRGNHQDRQQRRLLR